MNQAGARISDRRLVECRQILAPYKVSHTVDSFLDLFIRDGMI